MEPLFQDSMLLCYNKIAFDNHPGLRPLLHWMMIKFYHEEFNPTPPTLLFYVQWPELVLMKTHSYSSTCAIKLTEINDQSMCTFILKDCTLIVDDKYTQFSLPLSSNASIGS